MDQNNVDKKKNYELKTEGKYVFFAVAENAEKLKEAFKEAIK